MLTPEQLLAELNRLRKDYDDEKDDVTYQTLHHTLLFLSYQIAALKDYLKEAAERAERKA